MLTQVGVLLTRVGAESAGMRSAVARFVLGSTDCGGTDNRETKNDNTEIGNTENGSTGNGETDDDEIKNGKNDSEEIENGGTQNDSGAYNAETYSGGGGRGEEMLAVILLGQVDCVTEQPIALHYSQPSIEMADQATPNRPDNPLHAERTVRRSGAELHRSRKRASVNGVEVLFFFFHHFRTRPS
jgi:hypothetical protein